MPPVRRPTWWICKAASASNTPRKGALLDLTPYLTAHPDVKARFNPDYLNNWVWEGKNWLVPFYIAKTLLFYNKPLFQKAGLAGPATSFDELLAHAAKIGAGGEDQTGFLTLNFDWLYWALFRMNNIELLTPDLKQVGVQYAADGGGDRNSWRRPPRAPRSTRSPGPGDGWSHWARSHPARSAC